MDGILAFLSLYRLWVSAVIATIILILLIIKFWDRIKFWWLCFWTSFPVVGTIASLYKLKETERDGWFKSEKTICSKFYSFYRNLLGKDPDFYANCALYLEKAQETDRKEAPLMVWIVIFLLVVAEALGFAYVLAGYTIPGASESLQQKGALAIAFVISVILVGFTHFTGGEIYRNSVYKKIREWWINDDNDKPRLKPDNEEITLQNNRADDGRPKYIKVLNRVNANANVTPKWHITVITAILIALIAVGATYVRGQVLEKQLNQEISNIGINIYDNAPSELGQIQENADKKALEEQQDADRKGGWATFIVLAVLFVFIQILGILLGYKWGFVGKESKKAYSYIKGFYSAEEFEDYYEREKDRIISKANEKLAVLHSKMARYIGGTTINSDERNLLNSANQRTFERYIQTRALSKQEQKVAESEQRQFNKRMKNQENLSKSEPFVSESEPNQMTSTPRDNVKRREILEIKKELKELKKNGGDEGRILDLEERLLELED
jgi:hypothetical protein